MRSSTLICASLALAIAATGCAEDKASREDVIAACEDFEATVGRRFGECLGWPQAMIDSYIAQNQAGCEAGLEDETCWDRQHDSYGSCGDSVASEPCPELCPNDNCFVYCPYFCPTN